MLFKQQIVSKRDGRLAMIKSSDSRMKTERYGGYNEIKGAYSFFVEHTDRKKRIRTIETVYLMNKEMYESSPYQYCSEVLGLQNARILIPRIKFDSLFSLDGFKMHISGRKPGAIIYKNANQLVLSPEENTYIKRIGKYIDRCKLARTQLEIKPHDGIDTARNTDLYNSMLNKLLTKRYGGIYSNAGRSLSDKKTSFAMLDCYGQCCVLMEILRMLNTTAAYADLKRIGGSSETGRIVLSKNMRSYEGHEFKLINQSITGFFEQEIDMLGDFQ